MNREIEATICNCVICFSNVESGEVGLSESRCHSVPSTKLLDAQLNVIFTLRNIYELKTERLEIYLRKWGDPVNWVKLCPACEQDVSNIRNVFQRLSEIQREYETKKDVILERIQVQLRSLGQGGKRKKVEMANQEILKECRRIVHESRKWKEMRTATATRPPSPVITLNPSDGDKIACQLLASKKKTKPLLKFEENVINRVKVERDLSTLPEDDDNMDELTMDTFQDQIESKIIDKDNAVSSGGRISEDEDPDFAPEAIDSDSDYEPLLENVSSLRAGNSGRGRGRGSKRFINSGGTKKSRKKLKISCSDVEAEDDSLQLQRPRQIQRYKGQRKIRCPYCRTEFRVGPYLTYCRHLETCMKVRKDRTLDLKCSLCKGKWSCSSGNNRKYLEHVVVCKEKLKTPPVPWRHHVIKCNLCEDACYLPFLEFPSHILTSHQCRHGCTQCSYRCKIASQVSIGHWNNRHKDLLDTTPMKERVESMPEGRPYLLPDIPWWCPALDCLEQFKDEQSRDVHLQSCPVLQHQSPQRAMQCASCDRAYFSNEELLIHNVSSHGYLKRPTSAMKSFLAVPWNMEMPLEMKLEPVSQDVGEVDKADNNEGNKYKERRCIRCPYCNALFRVGPFLTFCRHIQRCSQSLTCSTPKLKCSMCKGNWSCPSNNIPAYLEHAVACWEYHTTHPLLPWRHSAIKCNLCEDSSSCYLPFLEFPTHVYNHHLLRHSCTQCTHRSRTANLIFDAHWNRVHGNLSDVPINSRVKSIPAEVPLQLPHMPWWCPALECLQEFSDEHSRDVHLASCQVFHGQRSFKCSICNKEYFSVEEVLVHRVSVHGYLKDPATKSREALPTQSQKYPCSICRKSFWSQYSLRKHVQQCRVRRLKCVRCNLSFATRQMYDEHKKEVHGALVAETATRNGGVYKLDLTQVTISKDKEGGTCNICGKYSKTIPYLRIHMMYVHEGRRDAMCSQCGKQFKGRTSLLYHVRRAHPSEEDLSKRCNFCNKTFSTKQGLQNHILKTKHSQVKKGPYVCPYPSCGKIIKKSGGLKAHIKHKHEKPEKPHICDICGKSFKRRGDMSVHIKRLHQGQFKFKCEICGKGADCLPKLLEHKAAIHSIGDYKCDVVGCSKVFFQEKLLAKHKKFKHEGLEPKPYQCSFCGKEFTRKGKMKEHELAIHSSDRDNKPFKCQMCGSSFALQKYLDYHVNYTHMKKGRNKVQKNEIKAEENFS